MGLDAGGRKLSYLLVLFLFATFIGKSSASLGDHLPEFKECVKVHTYTLKEQELANELIDRSVKWRIAKEAILLSVCLPAFSMSLPLIN